MKPIDQLLENKRAEGTQYEEGFFALSAEQSVEKLARFGLESAEKGLLRLIQLAHSAGAYEVEVVLGRRSVNVSFRGVSEAGVEVASLLESLRLDASNFALALLACLHSGFSQAVVDGQGSAWRLDSSGARAAQPDPEVGSDELRIRLQREVPDGFWEHFRSLLRRRCLDFRYLRDALAYCSAQVKLDGRVIQTDPRPFSRCLCEVYLFGPESLSRQGVAVPEPRSSRYWVRPGTARNEGVKRWQTFLTAEQGVRLRHFNTTLSGNWNGPKETPLAHLWIPFTRSTKPGKILLVSGGVVLDEVEAEFPLPLHGVVSAEGLDKDLSGIRVVHNDKLRELLRYLARKVGSQLRKLGGAEIPETIRATLVSSGYLAPKSEKPTQSFRSEKSKPTKVRHDRKLERSRFLTERRQIRNRLR